jgi:excisionase family DNA binding protein
MACEVVIIQFSHQANEATMRDLSPRDLAHSLGVSESSVKRWVDSGALTARRTAGGHRRIALAEAVRFVRESGVPLERPEQLVGVAATTVRPEADADEAGRRFLELLEADDASAARAMLLALYASGWPVAAICDGLMRFALERIGTLWHDGPAGISVEHRATDTCVRALAELRALFAPAAFDAPVAIGGAPGGDPYLLPSMMAAAVLADLGYRDYNLGADTPFETLAQAADRYRPRLVWVAMSSADRDGRQRARLVDLAAALAAHGAALVVGGRHAPSLPPSSGILHARSMAELTAFARGIRAAS